ncbi:hypothetical protein ABZP36_006091 [Zizania latifolia]
MGIAPVATYSSCSSSLARPPAIAGAARAPSRAHVAAAAISSRASSFVAGGGLAVAAASAAVAARPRTAGSGGGAMGCKCLFGLGVPELVVIAGVAALVFGPKKLPEIGRSIGKTVNSFQQAAKEFETELKKEPEGGGDQPPPPTPTAVSDGEEKKSPWAHWQKVNSRATFTLRSIEESRSDAEVLAAAASVAPLKTLNPVMNPSYGGRHRCSAQYREAAGRCTAPGGPDDDDAAVGDPVEQGPFATPFVSSGRWALRWSCGAVARGRIAVWKSATETTWVSLAFWDDLATVTPEHVKKGDRIFVSGCLVSDTVDEGPNRWQVYYKVVVQQLNFIESFQPVQLYKPETRDNISDQCTHISRRTQGIQTSSISTMVKHCGLMGGITPIGLFLSWRF